MGLQGVNKAKRGEGGGGSHSLDGSLSLPLAHPIAEVFTAFPTTQGRSLPRMPGEIVDSTKKNIVCRLSSALPVCLSCACPAGTSLKKQLQVQLRSQMHCLARGTGSLSVAGAEQEEAGEASQRAACARASAAEIHCHAEKAPRCGHLQGGVAGTRILCMAAK
jgi:hypothetical protein